MFTELGDRVAPEQRTLTTAFPYISMVGIGGKTMQKVCSKCGQSKDLEDFSPDKRTKDGRTYVCRDCERERKLQWERQKYQFDAEYREKRLRKSRERRKLKYHQDPEYRKRLSEKLKEWRSDPENARKKSERDKRYRRENKEKIYATWQRWYRTPKGKFHEVVSSFKTNYGIDDRYVMDLMDDQKGCCALCEVDFADVKMRKNARTPYVVDHCHDTGEVRGLLCQKCNVAVGYFECNIMDKLERFQEYVSGCKKEKE